MASIINAISSGAGGVAVTGDSSGVLNIQTSNTTAISVDASQNVTFTNGANLPNTFGFKNRIINGGMMIDQRNAGASVTPTNGQYLVDRFYGSNSQSSKFSAQQSTTAPAGFVNSLLITSLSSYSIISSDYFVVTQRIEGNNIFDLGFGAAGASTVTLSFWVRSSLTGTFGGALQNSGNTRSYPFTYTISSANTWEQKTVTVAGDTSGTWLTTNGVGLQVVFGLGVGSTYSGTAGSWAGSNFVSATGATSVVGTSGATWYVTGVQLEKGSTATSFDYRDYGRELMMCQRYLPSFISSSTSDVFGFGYSTNTTDVIIGYKLPVTARVQPTGVTVSSASNFSVASGSGGTATASTASFIMGNQDVVMMVFTRTGLTGGQGSYVAANSASGKLLFTGCEL